MKYFPCLLVISCFSSLIPVLAQSTFSMNVKRPADHDCGFPVVGVNLAAGPLNGAVANGHFMYGTRSSFGRPRTTSPRGTLR